MTRFCPECAARLITQTKRGSGIPKRVCPECGEQ